jgi:hypothetical protein
MRPVVGHDAVEVYQAAGAGGAGVEDITAVGEVGIAVRYAAELNEGPGQ